MSVPSCSACMIVKNEMESLERCLKSIVPLFDEIIIVDTGSTDGSQELCWALGAQVYEVIWEDDFAAARNESLRHASGDWIIWIDADEELVLSDQTEWKETLLHTEADVLPLQTLHYYGAMPPVRERSHSVPSHRFFRNRLGISFQGKIHEHLNLTAHSLHISDTLLQGIMLRHYGYLDAAVQAKGKHRRNLDLLLREQANTDDPWIAYHIASEYYRVAEYLRAFQEVNHAIRRFLETGTIPPPLAYKLKYELVVHSEFAESNLAGIEKALLLYPDYPDLHFDKAVMLFKAKDFQAALEEFARCLHLEDSVSKYLTLTGVCSFLPLYYMGLCQENLNGYEQARQFYLEALNCWPDFPEAAERLGK